MCCYYPTGWIFNNPMSLLIVGSTSRITQNIILHLARQNAYKSITITDLLPLYGYHHRYYRLRKALTEQPTQTTVSLTKLARTDELYAQIQQHQDVLFVTHDYFQSVTSKTKLMELTADFSKNVTVVLCRRAMWSLLLRFNTIILALLTHCRTISIVRRKFRPLIKRHPLSGQTSKTVLKLWHIFTNLSHSSRKLSSQSPKASPQE